jgi:Ulp1 family protease
VEYTKKESEKKPQDLSIVIIDTKCMTIVSLKRDATEKYLDYQLLNTFFSYTNRESRNGRNESLLSIHCYTTHFLTKLFQEDEKFNYTKVAQWCRKMRREDQNIFLKDALFFPVNFVHAHWSLLVVYPLEKRMDCLDSVNSHRRAGLYYAIIQYLQREYEQYYPEGVWSAFGWQFHQKAERKQVNTIDCGFYVCMNVYFIVYQLSLLSLTMNFVETEGRIFICSIICPHLFKDSVANKIKPLQIS